MNPICITEAQKTAYFKTFDRQRWQFLNAYTDIFKKALIKQIEPVLSELDKGISEAMTQVDIINEKPIREAYSRLYTQVGTYYASNVFNGLKSGKGFQTKDQDDLFMSFMQSWVELEGAELVTNVTANTKQYLKRILEKGIQDNLTIEEIAKQIRDSNRIGGISRARIVARTEIIRASNVGSLQGAKSSNLNLQKVWLSTIDSRVRIDHAEANNQKVGLDDFFLVGGEELKFPADPRGSASNTIACRCTTFYEPL